MVHDYNLIIPAGVRCRVSMLFLVFLGASFDDWGKSTLNVKEGHWVEHIDFVNGVIQVVDCIMNLT